MTDQSPLSRLSVRFGRLVNVAAPYQRVMALLITVLASGFLLGGAPGQADTPSALPDPSARLPQGDAAWEYWELNATFATGHRVSARVMITNFGPGSQSAIVLGHVTLPDGQIVEWDNGRKKSRWLLSDDKRKVDVGRSHLYMQDPIYIFDIDKERLHLNLRFAPDHVAPLASEKRLPEGYHTQTLAAGQAVTGQLWIADILQEEIPLSGFVSLTHSWGSASEAEVMLRRFELLSMEDQTSLEIVDLTTPDGTRFQWLAVTENSEMTYLTQDFEIAMEGRAPNYGAKKFWVPEKLLLTGAGVNGVVTLTDVTFSQNPLKVLPQPFRFMASFKSKPRRVWADASFELDIAGNADAPPVHRQGTGMAITTFMNPAKQPKK